MFVCGWWCCADQECFCLWPEGCKEKFHTLLGLGVVTGFGCTCEQWELVVVFLLFTPAASLEVGLNSTERWGCVQRLSSLFIDALSLFELRPFICSNNRSLYFPQGESKTEIMLLTSTANWMNFSFKANTDTWANQIWVLCFDHIHKRNRDLQADKWHLSTAAHSQLFPFFMQPEKLMHKMG